MSNKDILLDVIGDADPELIPDISPKKHRKIEWAAIGAGICAAAVIACIAVPHVGEKSMPNVSPYSGLPQVSHEKKNGTEMITSNFAVGAMGFEGLMAYDISELDTSNPWSEDCGITELPVYKNIAALGRETGLVAIYLTEEQMTKISENTAISLGTDIIQIEIEHLGDHNLGLPDTYLDRCIQVEAKYSDSTGITVYSDGKIKISFNNKKLPEEYSFTHNNTTADEAQNVLEYLAGEYSAVLAYDEPVFYSTISRAYSGAESRSYYVYDQSGDLVQDILNYNLSYAEFCPNDSGELMIIWLQNPLCAAEYLGEYQIISTEDARNKLLTGSYYTTVPEEYLNGGKIAEEDIKKCELVYRDYHVEYYQPFYKFYVELDPSTNVGDVEGLKDYGIFYVPAVEDKFLVNIEFN